MILPITNRHRDDDGGFVKATQGGENVVGTRDGQLQGLPLRGVVVAYSYRSDDLIGDNNEKIKNVNTT